MKIGTAWIKTCHNNPADMRGQAIYDILQQIAKACRLKVICDMAAIGTQWLRFCLDWGFPNSPTAIVVSCPRSAKMTRSDTASTGYNVTNNCAKQVGISIFLLHAVGAKRVSKDSTKENLYAKSKGCHFMQWCKHRFQNQTDSI